MIRSNFDDEEGERVVKPEFELQKPPRPMSRQASLMTSTRDLEATGPPDRTYKVVFAVSATVNIFGSKGGHLNNCKNCKVFFILLKVLHTKFFFLKIT